MERARPLRNAPWRRIDDERARIIACVVDRRLGARLTEAFRGIADVQLVGTYADVFRLVDQPGTPPSCVVVESHDGTGRAAAPFIRDLSAKFPAISIAAFCHAGIEHSPDIRSFANAGAHEFLFYGIDETGTALRAVLASATRECITDAVMRLVEPLIPSRLHAFVVHAVAHSLTVKRLPDVAHAIGLSKRTLSRYCELERFPPPVALLSWCRLFPAAYLLGTTSRTVESIALELDFASDTALRNQIKYTTGCRASYVRDRGGLEFVVGLFRIAIEEAQQQRGADARTVQEVVGG